MERIVIVDEHDNLLGEEDKEKCHDGEGILHRAFLAMVFNGKGELLLARRSGTKRLWPGYWDGTVASHIIKGETYEQASKRRLMQELGLETDDINYRFKFHYKIGYKNIGTENEICAVLTTDGINGSGLHPDSAEISEIRTVGISELMDTIEREEQEYTPWLILAVKHLRDIQEIGRENLLTPSCSGKIL
jgi:isopentenyl-diphosphate Delta-isomerase